MAAVVIVILKMILNRHLQELAIKKFELLKVDANEEKLEILTLVAPGEIPLALQKRIGHLCVKKFGRLLRLSLKKDPALKGGLIIQLKTTVIDYSLVSRLKEGGLLRSK